MKSVLISIRPQWCEKIARREKTIEVRKSAPKEVPFKAYIYCSKEKKQDDIIWAGAFGDRGKWNGHIIGEFVCDWITEITPHCDIKDCVNQYIHHYPAILSENDCLSFNEMKKYLGTKKGFSWHISDLKIYDKPKELSEFISSKPKNKFRAHGDNLTRPPQSYMFVEDV